MAAGPSARDEGLQSKTATYVSRPIPSAVVAPSPGVREDPVGSGSARGRRSVRPLATAKAAFPFASRLCLRLRCRRSNLSLRWGNWPWVSELSACGTELPTGGHRA